MMNAELIDALQCTSHFALYQDCYEKNCYANSGKGLYCNIPKLMADAADALEAADKRIAELEAETERLKASNEELRERQTYIDHWGNKWMTSGKDVPTAAYNHGFLDGEQACNGGAKMDGERNEQSDEQADC